MKVLELSQKLGYKILTEDPAPLEKEVTGVYTCDLLSHAMAKINQGDVWITVHTNLNVIAVASLTDCACVIIPEEIEVEEQTLIRAKEKGIAILSSSISAAKLCYEITDSIRELQ